MEGPVVALKVGLSVRSDGILYPRIPRLIVLPASAGGERRSRSQFVAVARRDMQTEEEHRFFKRRRSPELQSFRTMSLRKVRG